MKNDKTTAGTQWWHCPSCEVSSTRRRPDPARREQARRVRDLAGQKKYAESSEVTQLSVRLAYRQGSSWWIKAAKPTFVIATRLIEVSLPNHKFFGFLADGRHLIEMLRQRDPPEPPLSTPVGCGILSEVEGSTCCQETPISTIWASRSSIRPSGLCAPSLKERRWIRGDSNP